MTKTATTAAVPGVCPALLAAYEATPADWTLVGAIVDCAADNGEELVAEAVRWLRQKRRCPDLNNIDARFYRYGWYQSTCRRTDALLSASLVRTYDDVNGGGKWAAATRSELLSRFCLCWAAATAAERLAAWEWEPEPVAVAVPAESRGLGLFELDTN